MKALLQRVCHASVRVDGMAIGEINQGILVFLGIETGDHQGLCQTMAYKIAHYRLFSDGQRMNQNVQQIQGAVLLVSQFTLAADTQKGLRPGFSKAAPPAIALPLYQQVGQALAEFVPVQYGQFGADMQVSLVNDGPVTFMLNV